MVEGGASACNGVALLPGGQSGPHPPPAPRVPTGFSSQETHELRVSSPRLVPHPRSHCLSAGLGAPSGGNTVSCQNPAWAFGAHPCLHPIPDPPSPGGRFTLLQASSWSWTQGARTSWEQLWPSAQRDCPGWIRHPLGRSPEPQGQRVGSLEGWWGPSLLPSLRSWAHMVHLRGQVHHILGVHPSRGLGAPGGWGSSSQDGAAQPAPRAVFTVTVTVTVKPHWDPHGLRRPADHSATVIFSRSLANTARHVLWASLHVSNA